MSRPTSGRPIPAQLVTLALLLLTAAALFWPHEPEQRGDGALLVLMPQADPLRRDAIEHLAVFLGAKARLELRPTVVSDRRTFLAALPEALVAICPDAVALTLPSAAWQPLVVGRRRVPWNLRPSPVLVSRRRVEAQPRPWLTAPDRTVFGDSLSLVCLAPLCGEVADGSTVKPGRLPPGVSWGRDPFDHRGVLAAARYGAFDHAIVRQWDADAAFATGILDADQWRVQRLGGPVPDVVALGSRDLPRGARLDLQEALSVLGRREEDGSLGDGTLEARLGSLGLEGFNLLLGPDFERLRRRYALCWPCTGP